MRVLCSRAPGTPRVILSSHCGHEILSCNIKGPGGFPLKPVYRLHCATFQVSTVIEAEKTYKEKTEKRKTQKYTRIKQTEK
jgi:hypothetical protein